MMAARQRSMSGTIPSMEMLHEELKDNTIIVGRYLLRSNILTTLRSHTSLVLGASGDLAKKKVFFYFPSVW
jgi:glucose-6-phosphate 1-dehydrogenase